MPVLVIVDTTLRHALGADGELLIGMWLCTGSPVVAEICAGAGLDWLLIDAEHSPNTVASIQLQLQVLRGSAPLVMVRVPALDVVLIKQYLDLGVQNLLIPMVNDATEAERAVAAIRYPPQGVRGVGSALSRVSQWGRITDYLGRAATSISLVVQIETGAAVDNVESILAVDGVDAIFVGPSDLAASFDLLGDQGHPTVVAAVEQCIDRAQSAGKPCGVNAFAPDLAHRYIDRGARFVLVGADVTILAGGSTALAEHFARVAGGIEAA